MNKNLIILCIDEMRGDCLGASGRNRDIRTPHMDALAARGINFRQHHASFPKCVPARVSLMTGRYCHTDGYRTIFQHMPCDQPDLLSQLRTAGYQAALFGKNHCWENLLEATHVPPELPLGERGLAIDHHSWSHRFAPIYRRHHAAPPSPDDHRDPNGLGRDDLESHLQYRGRRCERADEAYAEQAIEYLRDVRDPARPFFLQVNFEQPHPPYAVEDPWFSMYDRRRITPWPHELPKNASLPYLCQREVRSGTDISERALREIQAVYMGMISKVDSLIGRVTKALQELGLFENSVVMLWSDHGDFAGQYGLVEKWDTAFADCLTNVPFVLCAPELPKGRSIDALSDHTDIAPTLTELLGMPPLPGVHGRSLLPVIRGEHGRDAVFADGGHEDEMLARAPVSRDVAPLTGKQLTYRHHPDSMARAKMIRTQRHKLVVRLRGGNELYDLHTDPWELDNRYHDPALASVRADLQSRLLEWCLTTDPDRPYQSKIGA
jgi:arylsulfatase A-like enzyme